MNNIGSKITQHTRVVERHKPLVQGKAIAIQDSPNGLVIGVSEEQLSMPDITPILQQVEALKECIPEKYDDTGLWEELDKLTCRINELEQRPLQLSHSTIIEKPGMTIHENHIKWQTPKYVWLLLGFSVLVNLVTLWINC